MNDALLSARYAVSVARRAWIDSGTPIGSREHTAYMMARRGAEVAKAETLPPGEPPAFPRCCMLGQVSFEGWCGLLRHERLGLSEARVVYRAMRTQSPLLPCSWLVAPWLGVCAGAVLMFTEAHCGTLAAVAPAVIDGLDRALVAEIEAAKEARDGPRERDLSEARRLLAEVEAARAGAEEAAKQATKALVLLEREAEEHARAQKEAQEARERRAAAALQRRLAKLRLIRDASALGDAGTGDAL